MSDHYLNHEILAKPANLGWPPINNQTGEHWFNHRWHDLNQPYRELINPIADERHLFKATNNSREQVLHYRSLASYGGGFPWADIQGDWPTLVDYSGVALLYGAVADTPHITATANELANSYTCGWVLWVLFNYEMWLQVKKFSVLSPRGIIHAPT